MYCSQCGKRIKDTMRFCPFCGSAVEVPEQEETPKQQGFSEQLRRDDSGIFIPLSMDESVWNVPDAKKEEPATVEPVEEAPKPQLVKQPRQEMKQPMYRAETRAQAEAKAMAAVDELDLPPRRSIREEQPTQTYTVQRRFDPKNIFFDEHADEDDDDDYIYEDEEDRSFLSRHMRGFVTLLLILIVVAICAVWMYSANGQKLLARFGFAWRADAIANTAHEDYLAGKFPQAAAGYAQALQLDPDSYDYARNAAIMYYQSGNMTEAANMAKRAIAIDSAKQDPYDLLKMIYPEEETMPEDVKALLEGK